MRKLKHILKVIILLLFVNLNGFAQDYLIDGYVLIEDLFIPVEDQIVKLRDHQGNLIASMLSDGSGYFSQEFSTSETNTSVFIELYRNCNGEVVYYENELPLNSQHLSQIFEVCENQSCEARFNYEQVWGNDLTFEFEDVSSGNIDQWIWDFGDEQASAEQNPTHSFQFEGYYTVSLTTIGENCYEQKQREIYVSYHNCLAKFSFEQVNQGQQLVMNFNSNSQGNIYIWEWYFGDGSRHLYTENPHHAYLEPGSYEVVLNIYAPGCSNSLRKTIVVNPLPACFPMFETTQFMGEELSLQFDDLSVGKSILYWYWQFGDGNTSDKQFPLHTYNQAGDYDVSLTVISASDQSTYSREVQVKQSSDCRATFTFDLPDPDDPEIQFTSLTTDDDLQFFWDFGDGTNSSSKSPLHQYDDFGNYEVELEILGYGCADHDQNNISIVEPIYCNAGFYIEQTYPQDRIITFNNLSFGNDIICAWDFGDGQVSSEFNPTHEYYTYGFYEAKLIISTSDDCIDSALMNIQILQELSISGNVFVGNSKLSPGTVYLYSLPGDGEGTLVDQQELDHGFYSFPNLLAGSYFLQAIPQFDFPFPVIPTYFPVYGGGGSIWQDAEIFHLDVAPQSINIHLGAYSGFFDGKGIIAGEVNSSGDSDDIPLIIYLKNPDDEIFNFSMLDEQNSFEFADIPFGDYKVTPEKTGKSSQPLELTLDETSPEMKHIVFLESSTSIIPDLSSLDDPLMSGLFVYPNPANDFIKIQVGDNQTSTQLINVKLYSSGTMKLLHSASHGLNDVISLAGFANGLYVLEITHQEKTTHRKLLIQH